MSLSILDVPMILALSFYPRRVEPRYRQGGLSQGIADGSIPINEHISLGYRLYAHTPNAPIILYFHGNGEIAPDHDFIADAYHKVAGASLLVVDYRGYGWSTGSPTFSALIGDTGPVLAAVPGILESAGLKGDSLYVMGRSMGSAAAIHLAVTYPEKFRGLIVESGFADFLKVLVRLGFPASLLAGFGLFEDPMGNARKIATLSIPLLIIHGEDDTLIPISQGEELYQAATVAKKSMLRVPGAGHNDLLHVEPGRYFEAIRQFVQG